MKHCLWVIFLISLTSFSLKAQTGYFVKGHVIDTSANVSLENTSISILNSKDSTLVKFTRANAEGTFSIQNLKPGKFILLVTYPKYADYVDNFTLDSIKPSVDFGRISLLLKSKLLADVIIKGQAAAIKIKGDTTEYNAGSFKIEPNSKVEDLLRQLPGIQVDKDGKITAQGETVNKVLVDGEEFFGDDPTLVTKNLRGDMVDKVQLYDKKSDQATFTGIDDGVRTKTINLKLKEDKKNGYFGKVDGGGGSDYYSGQAMFNAFKAKRKLAAYATLSNTGKTGLNWQDASKYGASNIEMTDGGGLMISGGRDELNYNGQGVPEAETGGAHYDAKWNNDRESINTNYKAGALTIEGVRNNLSQTNLPGQGTNGESDFTSVFNSKDDETFRNYTFRQKLDATYELKIDSGSNLKLVVDGTLRNNKSDNTYTGESFRGSDIKQNNTSRTVSKDEYSRFLFASVFYNKKLKKKGRTYSVLLSQNVSDAEDEGSLYSFNKYYDQQGDWSRDTIIDQLKTVQSERSVFNSNITYTEPLSTTLSLVLNAGLNINNSQSDRKSLNKSLSGEYNILDEDFSNNFKINQTSNQAGVVLNYRKGKSTVNFGTKVDAVSLDQIDLVNSAVFERRFININPQASFQYRFSQYKGLRLNYYGNTQQPSISQIQPVRVNTDPLNISLGNPDLRPSFRSSINFNYNSYKVLTDQYVYAYGSYSFNVNQIVSSTVTDPLTGKSTYQSVNLSDKTASSFNINANSSRKIKAIGFSVGLDGSISGNLNFNYINNVLNTLRSNTYSLRLNVSNYVAKKYNFWASFGPSYNTNKATVQTRSSNNVGGFRSNGSFTIYLPKKFEISSNYEYVFTKRTETFDQDIDYFILNSSFGKKFLKDESLKLTISGNDLLNQNIGFSRGAYGTSVSQNSYTTIRRYTMFSLLWDFNRMGGGIKPKN